MENKLDGIIIQGTEYSISSSNNDLQITDDTLISEDDLSFSDENNYRIFGISQGYPITKKFNGKQIISDIELLKSEQNKTEGIEEWSKMPKLAENPLDKVRFDGGMTRIFKNWGFIGDSLNSGEMYGYKTTILSLSELNIGKEISSTGLLDNPEFITTEAKTISVYGASIRLIFPETTNLSGKILLAKKVSESEYIPLTTGQIDKNDYKTSTLSTAEYIISYPVENKPQILYMTTYVEDMYELSWGQQLARLCGSQGYNFSVGGEYTKRWCIGNNNNRRWNTVNSESQTGVIRDAFTIALGVNDMGYWKSGRTDIVDYPCVTAYPNQSQYGSLTLTDDEIYNDIDFDDYNNNENSYAGWYAGIIQRIKSIRPDCHIFCITLPEGDNNEWNQVIRKLVEKFNTIYKNTIWCIDLAKYNPINANNNIIQRNCNLNGHWSSFGYLYAAYEISTYIDWLIRKNIDAFRGTSLIGTGSTSNSWQLL